MTGGLSFRRGSSVRSGGEGGLGTSVTRGDSSGRRTGAGGLDTFEVDPLDCDPCLGFEVGTTKSLKVPFKNASKSSGFLGPCRKGHLPSGNRLHSPFL